MYHYLVNKGDGVLKNAVVNYLNWFKKTTAFTIDFLEKKIISTSSTIADSLCPAFVTRLEQGSPHRHAFLVTNYRG
jgi:hypothetical protein